MINRNFVGGYGSVQAYFETVAYQRDLMFQILAEGNYPN